MSEIDGAVKMPADSIACPLRMADGTPCAWTYTYDAIEIEPGQLIEVFAPGVLQPTTRSYATWYASMEKMISQHLVDAHPVEDWARTMTTMRTEHHGALEQLHAGYSERINDLAERLRRAEDGRDERTRQLNEAGAKIDRLERENAELDECGKRLVVSEREIHALLERAWVLIANAWEPQGPTWIAAAEKWRDGYHVLLKATGLPVFTDMPDLPPAESQPESTRSAA